MDKQSIDGVIRNSGVLQWTQVKIIQFQSVVIPNQLIAHVWPHGREEARLYTSSLERTDGGM